MKMMRVCLCALLLLLLATPVNASTLMEDLTSSAGLERLEELVPANLQGREELLAGIGQSASLEAAGEGLLSRLLSSARGAFAEGLSFFFGILFLLFLSAFFGAMRQAHFRDSVSDVFDLLCVLVLSATCYRMLCDTAGQLRETLQALSSFISGLVPVTAAVYTLSGGVVTATAQSGVLLLALSVLDGVCVQGLLPLCSVLFALSAANAVTSVDFSGLISFLRRTVAFVLGGIYVVLLFVLGVQTVLSAASDSLALRSARFAAANFIPAVGGMFSEAAKTVFASVDLIRGGVGAAGCVVVVWLMLAPLVSLILHRGAFSLLGGLAVSFSLSREGSFLKECAEILGLCIAVCATVGLFFLLALSLFMQVALGG